MAEDPRVPLSRQAGRMAGRWWRRHGDTVKEASRPARRGWASLIGTLWILAYAWVGVLLAVGLRNITSSDSPLVAVAAIGGGIAMGMWQAHHRLARHDDPSTPDLRGFGLALLAWFTAIGLTLWIDLA